MTSPELDTTETQWFTYKAWNRLASLWKMTKRGHSCVIWHHLGVGLTDLGTDFQSHAPCANSQESSLGQSLGKMNGNNIHKLFKWQWTFLSIFKTLHIKHWVLGLYSAKACTQPRLSLPTVYKTIACSQNFRTGFQKDCCKMDEVVYERVFWIRFSLTRSYIQTQNETGWETYSLSLTPKISYDHFLSKIYSSPDLLARCSI